MNYLEFRTAMLPFRAFSVKDAEKRFPGLDTRRLVEWQKKGYIIKLINRWYLFTETERNESLLYRISNCIDRPSYVSLESALSMYHLIPESVHTVQAATTKKTQSYETIAGTFNYRSLKPSVFFGYTTLHLGELPLLVAEKEKAILDYLYLNTGIADKKDIAAMRLNKMETEDIDWKKFDHYSAAFNSKALNKRVEIFKSFLSDDAA